MTSTENQKLNPSGLNTKSQLSSWRLACLSLSLSFGLFLSLLDASIVATALYTMGTQLDALDRVTWVAEAYMLTYVGFAILFAGLADVFGRNNTYISATIIFLAFSLGCGFSANISQLIAFRALQGIGGSGLFSLAMIILPEISPKQLLKWLGSLAGLIVAVSGLCGPVLGGLFTELTTWRWVFWLNGPVCLLSLTLFLLSWPRGAYNYPAGRRSMRQLDVVGSILLSAACVLVVFAFQQSSIRANAWEAPGFLVPLIIGVVCWIALFVWQVTLSRQSTWKIYTVFPIRIVRNRVLVFGMVSSICTGFSYFVLIYNLPLRSQVVNGQSSLLAGVSLLPTLCSAALGSMAGGLLAAKTWAAFPLSFAGCCLLTIGTVSLATLSDALEVQSRSYGLQVLVGMGFGLNVSTATMLVTYMCEPKDRGLGQGIITQLRIFGGSVGLGAGSTILAHFQRQRLTGIIPFSVLSHLQNTFKLLQSDQQAAVRKAYSDAFSEIMKVCSIVCGVATILSFGMIRKQDLVFGRSKHNDEKVISNRSVMNTTISSLGSNA